MPLDKAFFKFLALFFFTAFLAGCESGESETSNDQEDTSLEFIWEHQTYFKALNAGAKDLFGRSIAASGDTLVVGAPQEDSNNPGISNSGSASIDNDAEDTGAVYIYRKSGEDWAIEAVIKSPSAEKYFGWRVAIDGDRLAVATDSSPTESIDGKIFLYQRTGSTWTYDGEVSPRNVGEDEGFGFNIDLKGTTLVVGASRDSSNSLGVLNADSNSLPSDQSITSGAVYVFERSSSGWQQQAYIKPPFTASPGEFGNSVALSGDRLLVGSPGVNMLQQGVFSNREDWTGITGPGSSILSLTGAAFTYTRSSGEWSLESVLANGHDNSGALSGISGFGTRVAMDGDTAVVYSIGDNFDSNTTSTAEEFENLSTGGVNGGSVSVYRLLENGWQFEAHLKSSNITASDYFGIGLHVRGDQIFVGAHGEDSAFRGVINGDGSASNDNSSQGSGAGYIFTREGSDWTQIAYLKGPTTSAGSWFGIRGVFLDDDTLLVSAPNESQSGNSIRNGLSFEASSQSVNSGAAYIFQKVLNPDKDRIPPMTFPTQRIGSYNQDNAPATTNLTCVDLGKNSQGCVTTLYTLDGSDPASGSAATQIYNGEAINLDQSGNTTLKTFSIDGDGNQEVIREYVYVIDSTAPTSSASVIAGTYAQRLSVKLSCDDANPCSVYYTLDGSEPTSSSVLADDQSILIEQSMTLNYFAVDEAGNPESTVNSEVYVIDITAPSTTVSPAAGTYGSDLSISLSCSDSGEGCATTYYTIDGSIPTTDSTQYTGEIVLNTTATLKYFSSDILGNVEAVQTTEYVIDSVAPTASASPAAGTYGPSVDVSLSCTDTDSTCALYYTLDGTNPTTSSPLYSSALTVNSDTTLKYLTVDAVGNIGSIETEIYNIDTTAPTIEADVASGSYNSDQSVTLSCTDDNIDCSSYYTTDGTDPTSGSTIYSSAIAIDTEGTTTVKFFSIDQFGNEGAVESRTYIIDKTNPSASTTTATETYTESQSVELSCSDNLSGCTLYYTTDGTAPNGSSTQYESPINIATTTTLKFVAIDGAGNESTVSTVTLTFANLIGDVIRVVADGTNTAVLKADGTVSVWGNNLYGVLAHAPGTDGDATNNDANYIYSAYNPSPSSVAGLTNVIEIDLGYQFAVALKDDGTVWAWGRNEDGQLGHTPGTNGDVAVATGDAFLYDVDLDDAEWVNSTPIQVAGLSNIIAISAGFSHSLALDNSGNVYAWGTNLLDELGDNTSIASVTPVQVVDNAGTGTLSSIVAIAAGGSSSMAVDDSGILWAWGDNSKTQLGVNGSSFGTPQNALTGVSTAEVSAFSAVALKADGTVWHWGDVYSGVVDGGGNPVSGITTPTQVAGLSGISEVGTNGATTFAIAQSGAAYAWGNNAYAQLGTNTTVGATSPTLMAVGSADFVGISKGDLHGVGLTLDGTVHLWGNNDFAQLGHEPNTNGDSDDGFGGKYNQSGITVNTIAARSLSAPTNLSVTDGGSGNLTISWSASAGASTYDVFWSNSPGVTALNGTLVANHTSGNSVDALATGKRYYVTVVAKDGAGNTSVGSTEASVTLN